MKLTKNISRFEIECPCQCGIDTFDYETALIVQNTVDHFQSIYPEKRIGLHVNSGNRCAAYNATIKGASPASKHTEFRAIDFFLYDKITGDYNLGTHIPEKEVYDYLDDEYNDRYGIGIYNGRIHFDSRSTKARWDKR